MSRTPARAIYDESSRRTAIFIGLMFLIATVTFLAGDALVVDALGSSGSTVHTGQLTLGVALQAVDALAVAAIGAAFVGVLARFNRKLAYGHFAFRVVESLVILGIGAYMLIQESLVNYEPIIYVFTGIAGLMFTTVLLQSGLVATWLARLGIVGYLAILAALPIDLLNLASLDALPGMLLYVPGGLFEVFLPILLITRGFRSTNTPLSEPDGHQPAIAPA